MPYIHGVQTSETPTSLLPPTQSTAGIPFIVGTAPVNMVTNPAVNSPRICYSYKEAVAAFGYASPDPISQGSDWKKHAFTISEFIKSHFTLYANAPVVIVNILNPAEVAHQSDVSGTLNFATGRSQKISEKGIILSTFVLTESGTTVSSDDYTAAFDDDGNLLITSDELTGNVSFTAKKLNPSAITDAEIQTAISLAEEVFPRFRVVPGVLLAPWFSSVPGTANALSAQAKNINDVFKAGVALIDAPTTGDQATFSNVVTWKNTNSIVNKEQVICWPKVENDKVIYAMSTHLAGLIASVDGENDDVPYVSPSNKNVQVTGAVTDSGTEIFLDQSQAATLNGDGIATILNFIGGWKFWGNRTACYPTNTDPKDSFICIERMFTWIANTLVTDYWSKLDNPLNRRQIDTIVDSANMWLNGLSARQYILGGRVEFLDSENSTTDLMDGKATFHVYITPPSPNREIDFVLEYDPDYLSNLFE